MANEPTQAGAVRHDGQDERPDEALMQAAARGDKESFVHLVHRFQNPLLNFFRRLGVYTDAEDLVQDTFIRLFRYRKRYRPSARFKTFLYLVARQVRIDYLRKADRKRRLSDTLRRQREVEQSAVGSVERRAGEAADALARLPDRMKEVVVLSIYQGLKYREIGKILRIPEGTVKSRMFNALRRLREIMDEQ
ncbi:RNA polymerase sigma factor [Verrucomicrobiota bacterium]